MKYIIHNYAGLKLDKFVEVNEKSEQTKILLSSKIDQNLLPQYIKEYHITITEL